MPQETWLKIFKNILKVRLRARSLCSPKLTSSFNSYCFFFTLKRNFKKYIDWYGGFAQEKLPAINISIEKSFQSLYKKQHELKLKVNFGFKKRGGVHIHFLLIVPCFWHKAMYKGGHNLTFKNFVDTFPDAPFQRISPKKLWSCLESPALSRSYHFYENNRYRSFIFIFSVAPAQDEKCKKGVWSDRIFALASDFIAFF